MNLKKQYMHKFFLIPRHRAAPYGFYFGPLISFATANVSVRAQTARDAYAQYRKTDFDLVIGVQAGKARRLTVDLNFGAGYKNNHAIFHYPNGTEIPINTTDLGPVYNSHLNVLFCVSIGYSL